MAGQIRFFEKSKCDFSVSSVTVTASEGNTYAPRLLDRTNLTAWMTTGSVDANNTTIEFNFGDARLVDAIFLIKMNFKSYKVEYWNGSAWTAFTSAIDETTNTVETKFHSVTQVETTKLRLTIRGTFVANDEKQMYQFIATEQIGQLAGWPIIKKATLSRNRIRSKMLSGKENIREQIGAFSCSLSVSNWKSDADLTIVEHLHDSNYGFLVWLCGGSESQFSSVRKGYRLEDIFLMKCASEYNPDWFEGIYPNGIAMKFDLVEVVD